MIETPSGLKYIDLVVGTGAMPENGKRVSIHYTGTLENGNKFDSSMDKGVPFKYVVGQMPLIKGWEEGLSTMRVGGKRKLIIPSHLGYGKRGSPPVIPSDATLIFELELLEVK